MNSNEIQDLKENIIDELRAEIKASEERLESKLSKMIDDLSLSIDEALENSKNEKQKQLDDHENRITQLERSLA